MYIVYSLREGVLSVQYTTAMISAIGTGLVTGFIVGMLFGGVAILQHFILRFVLARNGCLPWRLIPFLDYCTDLIFLRRVGGGYIFVHRLLMEHFAEMDNEPQVGHK